ncbi:helix-turn-helix domain-containing protein [Clostridium estertheticum]|uniref:GH39 family glycosyl hydrolase n=1 Tax=Clostridium estertheticum TaxID=238834 RepID=UPI001C0D93A8|nr:helix-turn-helix domain-containing protein [Clostridium estertheticum]MBU3201338.1 helix-turn-helix domain-containing protein [Clostridium estertheticum]WAG66657.1 helix-turn-helix domain-containing protein [Clostridium estertheticum]
MNIDQELVNFKSSSSMHISVLVIENSERYWHQSIEIIYILSGSVQVQCRNMLYNLHKDDLILINMFDVHALSGDQCEVLSLKIDISALDPETSHFSQNRFDCNSCLETDKTKFIPLKRLLALIVKSNVNPEDNIELLNKSYVYELLYILTTNFKVEGTTNSTDINKNSERIKNILNYISDNYREKVSLNNLSETFYLSMPYISKIFKEFIGLSFSDYLTNVRLSHAVKDLANSNFKIEYVAEKNGFSNTRSFVSAFRNKYECLPSKYRKELDIYDSNDRRSMTESINYFALRHSTSFDHLVNYLKEDVIVTEENKPHTKIYEINPIDVSIKGVTLRHTFKTLTCIGKAKHILISENQHMLREVQHDIRFEYIRFHGLLDDEMMFYSENENGNPELCFTYIDLVIDFLFSINLKPFMELSFMPKELAIDPARTMFFISSIISLPKSMEKWIYIIKQLIKHFISRYGIKEVESWPFFVWNEPDLIKMYGFENRNEFFSFYKETYKTIKKISPSINFGSSPVFADTLAGSNDWLDTFMNFCKLNDCLPDFINMHFYPINLSGQDATTISRKAHGEIRRYLVYMESENALSENIQCIKKRFNENNWKTDKLYLSGWNSSISNNELLNDTVYKAAYIAKNILENYDTLESFGYWQISDFSEEVKMKNQLFHGGQGIFTYNGIKKSHYYVFQMLSKLSDRLLEKGDGFFITTDGASIQIILYNYQHYSKLYAAGEVFDMTFNNRYTPFPKNHTLKLILPLTNLCESSYQLTETIVNREYGSSFDKWLDLGGVPLENKSDVEYLKSVSLPRIQKKILSTENNALTITAELEPHEVRLIEINPLY